MHSSGGSGKYTSLKAGNKAMSLFSTMCESWTYFITGGALLVTCIVFDCIFLFRSNTTNFVDTYYVDACTMGNISGATCRSPTWVAFYDRTKLIAVFLLAMDALAFAAQAIDLFIYNWTSWPLTMLAWLGMLTGVCFSVTLLATFNYTLPMSIDESTRDSYFTLALLSVIFHCLFAASNLSVGFEYFTKHIARTMDDRQLHDAQTDM